MPGSDIVSAAPAGSKASPQGERQHLGVKLVRDHTPTIEREDIGKLSAAEEVRKPLGDHYTDCHRSALSLTVRARARRRYPVDPPSYAQQSFFQKLYIAPYPTPPLASTINLRCAREVCRSSTWSFALQSDALELTSRSIGRPRSLHYHCQNSSYPSSTKAIV